MNTPDTTPSPVDTMDRPALTPAEREAECARYLDTAVQAVEEQIVSEQRIAADLLEQETTGGNPTFNFPRGHK